MSLKILSFNETRVIGCLVEKSLTTPEQYPLSLNALTNACNQKSNREPVTNLTEAQVQDVVQELETAGLVRAEVFGNRVAKYKHRFCNTEFSELKLSKQELGIVCVLFLRGPQTPGELRTRTNRLCQFDSLEHVDNVLNEMGNKQWVVKLEREPGKREARFAHLFSGDEYEQATSQASISTAEVDVAAKNDQVEHALNARIEALESEVAALTARISDLEELLN